MGNPKKVGVRVKKVKVVAVLDCFLLTLAKYGWYRPKIWLSFSCINQYGESGKLDFRVKKLKAMDVFGCF